MGYTHYWTQTRDFGKAEWAEIKEEAKAILDHVRHRNEIPLGNPMGDRGSSPVIDDDVIAFNGIGDDSHESFVLNRRRAEKRPWESRRGWDFTKTARKPYDVAVTAMLCWLATVRKSHDVSSDGHGDDFVAGLEMARQALPRYANALDIPMDIMREDRWTGPWTRLHTPSYEFGMCVDGRAYIVRRKDGASYAFPSHHAAARWAQTYDETGGHPHAGKLFAASGSFDEKRQKSIGRQQAVALAYMVDHLAARHPGASDPPPAFVRPGSMPLMTDEARRDRPYDFAGLLGTAES